MGSTPRTARHGVRLAVRNRSRLSTGLATRVRQYRTTGFTKATVQAHVATLRAQGVNASSINQRLTAIRKLATELADNGVIDHSTTQVVSRVEGVRKEGKRLGNWLTKEQAQKLLQLPDVATIKGLRVGFYITDYLRIPTGFAVEDFDRCVEQGLITIVN